MQQFFEWIKMLDWAQNWLIYFIAIILASFLVVLVVKLLLNKIKQLFIMAMILTVLSLLSYMLFLAGIIEFDVLTLVGLGDISIAIQTFIENIISWFNDVFSIGTVVRFIK